MVKNYQAYVLLLWALVVVTAALPQHGIDKVAISGQSANAAGSIDLPFLQFKNGGIRVNFAGYHAEAGLGGLLGGSDAKGGLFASAGTPWGPSASAGLGGVLGGQDGTARGGLHARAGLGNGRPEAAAGLGGSLDGSARSGSRARGGLYAGATAGGPEAAAGLGGSLDGSGASGSNRGSAFAGATDGHMTKIAIKEVSHIQSVPPQGEKVYLTKSGAKDASKTLEFKLPAANSKNEVSSSIVTRELGNPGPKYEVAGANSFVANSDVPDFAEVSYPTRRYYRKRYRNNPVRKHTFYKFFSTNTGPVAEVPAASASAHIEGGVVAGKTYEEHPAPVAPVKMSYGVVTKAKSTTLFDDIFNEFASETRNNVASVIEAKKDILAQGSTAINSIASAAPFESFFPSNTRETVRLESENAQSLAERQKPNPIGRLLENYLKPIPLVDKIQEVEKYGNAGDKFIGIGRALVGSLEGLSNFLNAVVDFPIDTAKKTSRGVTEALNQLGGRLVGLQ